MVNANGTELRGKAVASTSCLSTGVHDVRVNRDISWCAWTGTVGLGTFGGSTGRVDITVSGRAGTTNRLFVTAFNGPGGVADLPFLVVVVCS